MNNPQLKCFEQEDVLLLVVSEEAEAGSVEISPNVTAELNAKGELIGIEIARASSFLRNTLMDSVQAKMLNLPKAESA